MDLTAVLRASGQDYESTTSLSPDSREELAWWDTQMANWNGKSVLSAEPDLIIESDASKLGWGAWCRDISTGGPWSPREASRHINCLELLAAMLAVKMFAKNETRLTILHAQDRQHNGGSLHQQSGRDSVERACLTVPGAMDVVPGKEHPHSSRALAGRAERGSGQGVKGDERPVRLEARPVKRSTVDMGHWRWTCSHPG